MKVAVAEKKENILKQDRNIELIILINQRWI